MNPSRGILAKATPGDDCAMKKESTNTQPLPKDVLVVEDSATQAAVLKLSLEKHGWRVRVAGNGVEALELARRSKPDVVVSDIRMPRMDGYALSKAIKSDPALSDVPVVLLTSLSQSSDIIDTINSRADYYFLKQWEHDVLISKIESILDQPPPLPDHARNGFTVYLDGEAHIIEAGVQQSIPLLLSTYDIAIQQNRALADARDQLRETNESLEEKVRERTAQFMVSETRYRRLFEASKDGILILDSETGMVVDVNPSLVEMLGLTHEQLLGTAIGELEFLKDAMAGRVSFPELMEKGHIACDNLPLRKRDGTALVVEFLGNTYRAGDKMVIQFNIRDITERTRAEESLRASEAAAQANEELTNKHRADAFYARQLIEASPDPLVIISPQGAITDVNAATEQITDQSRKELIGGDFGVLFTEPERARAGCVEALAKGRVVDYPLTVRLPSGPGPEVLYNASVYRDDQGRVLGVLAAARDVTERMRVEAATRASELKYRSLIELTGTGFLILDPDGRVLDANREYVRLSGRGGLSDILGRNVLEWTAEAAKPGCAAALAQCVKSGFIRDFSTEYVDGSGKSTFVDMNSTMEREGESLHIISLCRDSTERHRLTDALGQVTERLDLAVRAGGVGIWDYDLVNNHLVWDEQMFRLYGIPRSEFGGAYEAWQEGLHPADRQRGDEELQLALRGEKKFDMEFRAVWPDGTTHYIRANGSVHRDDSGRPLRMIGTNWDITGQKRAEAELRESESNFRTFFESLADLILVGTPGGRLIYANAAVTSKLGYSAEELNAMHLLDLYPADKRQEAKESIAAMSRLGRDSCSLPLAGKDGSLIPVETRVWLGKWNGAECLFGFCKDLSAEQEAHQRFERLFRKNPSLMALSDIPDQRFTDVNDTFLNTLGYSGAEIIGRTTSEIGLFPHPEQQAAAAAQLLADGSLADLEMQVRRQDGAILDGLFSGGLIDIQGRQYLMTVMSDITDRKRLDRQMLRLSATQKELMHLATDFVNVPLERQDAAINESLETMGELIDADRAYLFAYDFGAGVSHNTHEWCRTGITPEIGNMQAVPLAMVSEWVDIHRQGNDLCIPCVAALPADSALRAMMEPQGVRSLITLPLMSGDECLGFVGFDAVRSERIWTDEEIAILRVLAELYSHFRARLATESKTKELQISLTRSRDEAQAAARAKSLFLANMSHEIRTPLNAILGYAQIMEHECRSCPTGRRLSAITRSGEHLLSLITDLLSLVRDDAQTITLAPRNFNFHQALDDVRLMFLHRPEAQGLSLDVSHTPDVPPFIFADSVKVRQILVNLVGNAVKFTDTGGVRLSASLVSVGEPGDLLLAVDVEDTGCGISEEEVGRIFDLFYVTRNIQKTGQGTGLGLPLSQRFARALGGDIIVRSRPGSGCCFRFTFRARAAIGAGDVSTSRIIDRLMPGQRAYRLLLVDDDQANLDMLRGMLTAVGFEVETKTDASGALHRLSQGEEAVDLVMMDKNMPAMDGYEAIGRIRALPEGLKLPVLVVTASGFYDERGQALAAGADGCVLKPVLRGQLLEELGRLVGAKYVYEAEPTAAANPTAPDSAALAQLPAEQRLLIDQALRRGDIRQLRATVAAIALKQAELAAGIGVLVDAYDYVGLRRLLDSKKE
jgi:PAS domain S-box-containing protein